MPRVASMSAAELVAAGKDEVRVLDLSRSLTFRTGHVPGALWTLRSCLADVVVDLPAGRPIAVMDGRADLLAALAVQDLHGLGCQDAVLLRGGLAAWRASGGRVDTGLDGMLTAMDDCYHLPADLIDDPEQSDRDYLAWEATLVEHLARDGMLTYRPTRHMIDDPEQSDRDYLAWEARAHADVPAGHMRASQNR